MGRKDQRTTRGPSTPLLKEEEQSNELTELDYFVLRVTFDFDLFELCMHSSSYLVKFTSLS